MLSWLIIQRYHSLLTIVDFNIYKFSNQNFLVDFFIQIFCSRYHLVVLEKFSCRFQLFKKNLCYNSNFHVDTKIFLLMLLFKFSCWCYYSNFHVDVIIQLFLFMWWNQNILLMLSLKFSFHVDFNFSYGMTVSSI